MKLMGGKNEESSTHSDYMKQNIQRVTVPLTKSQFLLLKADS